MAYPNSDFPTALDTVNQIGPQTPGDQIPNAQGEIHSGIHAQMAAILAAIESVIGITGSADVNSIMYKLANGFALKPDIQVFTTPGANVWTKPAGCTVTCVAMVGGGAGGGAGRRGAAGTVRCGGGGGASGTALMTNLESSLLGSTEAVTVGAAGTGAAAQTVDDSDGAAGTAGNDSAFGFWITAFGGLPGAGGTATDGVGGIATGGQDGASASTTGAAGVATTKSSNATGGAAGAGITAGDAASDGAAAGDSRSATGGTAGTTGGDGGNGGSVTANSGQLGAGGGSGASSLSAASGRGGNGGVYGAGGGGGAASLNGNNSGQGGDGAPGIAIVISW